MGSKEKEGEAAWLSEAIVDYLKGPMYITPLMSFIDQECQIFTPEEENKFEYTTAHNKFKTLVDKLLTDFLKELGVSPDSFFAQVSKAQEKDRLTNFVVQTILTVDDFLMFKAMMVKRNIDLTNQVLDAFIGGGGGGSSGKDASSKVSRSKEESELIAQAIQMSKADQEKFDKGDSLKKAMRALQVEDEDDALAVAIAASLRDAARADTEQADLNLAIALSLAMEAERQRMLLELEAAALRAALASKGAYFEAELARLRKLLEAKGNVTDAELAALRATLNAKGFDAAEAELAAIRAALAAKGASVDAEIAALKAELAKRGVTGKAADMEIAALKAALAAAATDPSIAAARNTDKASTALKTAVHAKGAAFEAELAKLRAALEARGIAMDAELAALRAAVAAKGYDAAEAEIAAIRACLAARDAKVEAEVAALKAALAKRGVAAKQAETETGALKVSITARATDPAVAAARAMDAELAKLRALLQARGVARDAELAALRAAVAAKGFGTIESEIAALRALLAAKDAKVEAELAALKDALAKRGVTGKAAEAELAALKVALEARNDAAVVAARATDVKRSNMTFGAGSGPTKSGPPGAKPAAAAGAASAAGSAAAGSAAAARPSSAKPSAGGASGSDIKLGPLASSTSPSFTPGQEAAATSTKPMTLAEIQALNEEEFKHGQVKNKAAGYKTTGAGGLSAEAVRKAAQDAADTQKNIAAAAGQDQKVWLEQQKLKLIAARKAEREAELEEHLKKMASKEKAWTQKAAAAAADPKSPKPLTGADADAKRTELRERLASKMLQGMIQKGN